MKDKDETKQKIINAVGEIFKTQGRKGLKIAHIAKKAGVDRSLIYQYFTKNIDRLLEDYIIQRDYWMKFAEKIKEEVSKSNHETSKGLIIDILQKQWQYFATDTEMQHLILWELSGDSAMMRSIHNARELQGQPILELAEEHFKGTDVKFKPISALLLGGIYYANLHTIYNGNIMCGMDVKSTEGQKEIMDAIRQLVEWAYRAARNE
ncbi:TetR/AcrR family transcriptional regulator [Mucilaginibacter sp. cycad4]|uniref:TetR/AcrR family transcriptional regulator n=1 Tax=Mucilaginibacter sp. cycad4 TaxID=3342096 RepID=UPI002AAB95F4|nr:TetR/AcrR family transcriptional regulator [Mucilaginibacter gossypii]WPU97844.1 TetR/AcrR family transcriptional regulator [Mucilaginibacter gossypii]